MLTLKRGDIIYTTAEVAAILGANLRVVQRWIKDGRLPALQIGRETVVLDSDLSKFKRPTPKPGSGRQEEHHA